VERHASFVVARALEFIEARACEPGITLAPIAAAADRSTSRLSHLLLKETGRTFRQHVNAARVRRAMALLSTSTLSVKEVARQVAWWTSQLDRQFRRETGLSPAGWRARSNARGGPQHDPSTNSTNRQRIGLADRRRSMNHSRRVFPT
jgi:transcriptional regulator GlxA family with amidase domain